VPLRYFWRRPTSEDAMQLYGFMTKDEREMFQLLITVNGIGPKGALGILSIMDFNSRISLLAVFAPIPGAFEILLASSDKIANRRASVSIMDKIPNAPLGPIPLNCNEELKHFPLIFRHKTV